MILHSLVASSVVALAASLVAVAPRPPQDSPKPASPAAATAAEGFPASWFGTWRGGARTENRGGSGFSFDMELHVAPTDAPDRFRWTIVYESREMRRQERPYELVVKDRAKGLYAIDEKNGIVIDAWHSSGALYSHFVVNGNRIGVVDRLTTSATSEPEIVVEITTVADEDLVSSGGAGGVPPVRSAAPRSVQRAILRKIAPK